MRDATALDVAARAGVSTATVSRVVNGNGGVSAEITQRVQQAIIDLAYRPSPTARNLRKRTSGSIALVVPSITNPFFPELVTRVHHELQSQGFALVLVSSETPGADTRRIVQKRGSDGIILVGSTSEHSAADALVDVDIPVVALDRTPDGVPASLVRDSNEDGAREVVEHLLAHGHRKIAHIAGPAGLDVSDLRAEGYRHALATAGRYDSRLIERGDFSEESGLAATNVLLDRGDRFDAVFAANDLMAVGALAALHARGLRVPDDVAVAGFDGIHLGGYVNPTLTTYVQPVAEIAETAVRLLVERIRDIQEGRADVRDDSILEITGSLLVRESSSGEAAVLRQPRDASTADSHVVVVGSINLDQVSFVAQLPAPGETVLATEWRSSLGGKGANQAIAAAKVGVPVAFVGAIGRDAAGQSARTGLLGHGIDIAHVERGEGPTGIAQISVDADGQNAIIVSSGANRLVDRAAVERAADLIAAAAVVVSQGELPADAVDAVAQVVRQARPRPRFVLNLAPVIDVTAATLAEADPLIVNEAEAAHLLGTGFDVLGSGALVEQATAALRSLVPAVSRSAVITLGERGAVAADGVDVWHQPPLVDVDARDTTGAGDAFTGVVAAFLARGESLRDAVRAGVVAGSFSVTSVGSSESYASEAELLDILRTLPDSSSKNRGADPTT